jgi:cyclohexanone monooxygenase
VTAEALKPYYRQFCKRPCFHDQYLPTYNRPNVTLVDTEGRGVERITKRAVVVGGREYPLDCLIFATGFEVGTAFTRRAGYEILGRKGLSLSSKWEKGMSTFHGFSSRGFPNCFIMCFIQSGLTPNFPHVLDEQSKHVAYIIAQTLERGFTTVEASQAAETDWVRVIHELGRVDQQFRLDCTPGFLNNEGKPDEGNGWFGGSYGEGADAFFRLLKEWRETGDLQGLELG